MTGNLSVRPGGSRKRLSWSMRYLAAAAGVLPASLLVALPATAMAGAGPEQPPPSPTNVTRTPAKPSPWRPPPPPPPAYRPASQVAINDAQWAQIRATGTWHAGCPVGRAGLVNLEVPYYGFDHRYHRALMTVNRDVARSAAKAFEYMAANRFPIYRVGRAESYGGSDTTLMRSNISSGFNCRSGSEMTSPSLSADAHANGRAVDLNPVQNPWLKPTTNTWEPNATWLHRRSCAYQQYGVVCQGGIAWTAFRVVAGWSRWQTATSPDYQHFDTGYPSRYLPGL